VAYHQQRLRGIESTWANRPIELSADYGVVRDSVLREIDTRFRGGNA
jgi:hypothetical protein